MAKLTLLEIIAKRKQGEMDKLQVANYKSKTLGTNIEIRKIPLKKYMSLIENTEDENSVDSMNKVLFECCPLFSENTKEAMKEYKVKVASDLPSVVLEDQMNEMKDIVEIINKFYGLDKIDSEEIKN